MTSSEVQMNPRPFQTGSTDAGRIVITWKQENLCIAHQALSSFPFKLSHQHIKNLSLAYFFIFVISSFFFPNSSD